MVSVALMSDPAGAKSQPEQNGNWSRARTGQSVLLVELVTAILSARLAKDMSIVCRALFLLRARAHDREAWNSHSFCDCAGVAAWGTG